ncbi:DUF2062 domain-containing protein [Palleronia sp. KMU-117]|uniref:DUF2062 domain-containing protein n=1 Tax=Palleronia sp. KMU-117 TaxID=3434108 RepID=UPI003D754FFF
MVFKRRTPRTYYQIVAESFYPRGGWRRASQYVIYRLRRLPDPAHKISRGVAAGVFVSFTPFFGFHFILAAGLAVALRGNILASLLATFIGNPITFPIIAAVSMEIGSWMLGSPPVPLNRVGQAFSQAFQELWHNFYAVFSPEAMHWDRLADFFRVIFLPYLVGGIIPGIVAGLAAYYLSYPIIVTYQKARDRRKQARLEKKRRKRAEAGAAAAGAQAEEDRE